MNDGIVETAIDFLMEVNKCSEADSIIISNNYYKWIQPKFYQN